MNTYEKGRFSISSCLWPSLLALASRSHHVCAFNVAVVAVDVAAVVAVVVVVVVAPRERNDFLFTATARKRKEGKK